ncbi:hypothetical protein [Agrobacterium larrymoorei]|uniref:Uncharacterized protein n=1 Tax=Agrobacterium larrymoorei TaxID=160699 RepID=A0A4D7DRR9_9HYPH|nr:hypothetical protein [Agrobacterium larrymoorei]QCI96982.1 hypothetical protein CFBP5473_03065 [Agrobacterium larrymoorei]QYA07591.1 hypothetical protein J5285_02330 [Agrobacterium larrymoorei]WHA41626.1 hypothetical protein CFBP5477_003050 [Agrobacterium larrymoorei]
MAYDWSGNEVKQQRYDLAIVAGLLAIISIVITAPFMLTLQGPPTPQAEIYIKIPGQDRELTPMLLARS